MGKIEQNKAEQGRMELYSNIAGIVESFMEIPYSQQKTLLTTLTESWAQGVFPSDEKEIVGAIFALASSKDERASKIKDDAIVEIWNRIQGYALSLIQNTYSTFLGDEDKVADILSCCKLTVITKIPDYDPAAGVPITFFDRDLHAAIREGIASIMPGMKVTSYHVEKQKHIRKAINELRMREIEVTAKNIKEYCLPDMSLNSILAEMEMMENSTSMMSLNADDVPDTPSPRLTPEEEYIKNENIRMITALIGTLTPKQRKICEHLSLIYDETPEKSGRLAIACGMSLAEYRQERADIVRRLTAELQTGKYGEELKNRFVHANVELGSEKCITFGYDDYDEAYDEQMDGVVEIDLQNLTNQEYNRLWVTGRAYEGKEEEIDQAHERN